MTSLPEPNDTPNPSPQRPRNRRLWLMLLTRVGVLVVLAAFATIAGGIWYGWKWVHEQLAPTVEASLSKSMNRPVKLGKLEQVDLHHLRFGKSEIPATKTDRDRATIDSVEVNFNLLQALTTRKVNLDVTLNKPDLYLDQTKDGTWIATQITQEDKPQDVTIELQKLKFRDGTLELAPFPKEGAKPASVKLKDVEGETKFADKGRQVAYDLNGKLVNGGQVALQGELLNRNGLNFNFNVRGQDFAVADVDRIVKFPIDLKNGRGNGNVNVQLRPNQRPIAKGTADFKDVTVEVPRLPQILQKATGSLKINDTLITLEKTKAELGKIPFIANGMINTQKGFDLSANVRSLSLKNFFDTFKVQLPFAASGEVNAAVKLTGAIDQPILSGSVKSVKSAKLDRIDLANVSSDFRLDTRTLNLTLANIQATPTVGGQVSGSGAINLNTPQSIALNFTGQNLPGDAIARLYNADPGAIKIGRVNAQTQLVGPLDNVRTSAQWKAPEATYPATGEVIFANGNTTLRNTVLQVAGGTVVANAQTFGQRWEGTVNATDIRANQFAPSVQGKISGDFKLAGVLSSFNLADIQANGTAKLTEGIGNINAKINASRGQWTADTQIAGITLNQFSKDLRGQLSGDLRVAGNVNSLSPNHLRADGQVRLSEGISLITEPLNAQVAWNGQILAVKDAIAPGFRGNGTIAARLDNNPEITALDLNVQTTGYALTQLPIPRPEVMDLAGVVDLKARITGKPAAPIVVGNTTVRGLALNGIEFEPNLQGTLQLNSTQGLAVNVAGNRDRIQLALTPTYQPLSLNVQRGAAELTGRAIGNNLFALNVKNLDLQGFAIPGIQTPSPGGFGGQLAGNVTIDLARQRIAQGSLSVQNPQIGVFRGDAIAANFVNHNNVFRFGETTVRRGASTYSISGDLDIRSSPKFDGQVAIAQGRFEDILQTLQFFRIDDFSRGLKSPEYGTASDLKTADVGHAEAPLDDQLKRFSEIHALLQQRAIDRQAKTVPELADVRGRFDGKINFSVSLQSGVKAAFDLTGENVEWRPYPSFTTVAGKSLEVDPNRPVSAQQVIAKGTLDNGVVNLSPLQLQSGDAMIKLSGQFGGEVQTGQLTVTNLSLDEVNRVYPLPLDVTGKVNASAFIQGRRDNPFAIGSINLTEGAINGTQIQSASGNFNYTNARLNVSSNVAIAGPEPLKIEGSIPYRLPFASKFPESDQIDLKLNVRNEGLALLNLLVPQVSWQGGQGDVNLQVSGRLLAPIATGTATFTNATIGAQALPGPLTGVNGLIRFDRDRIRVETFKGQFSDGQVVAQGVLPIFGTFSDDDPDALTPLNVVLNKLAIKLKGLYQGAVNGGLAIRGTALAPQISGEVRLTDGQVLLPDNSTASSNGATGSATGSSAGSSNAGSSNPNTSNSNNGSSDQSSSVEFQNLKLVLGDRVRIVSAPIINFLARGELSVNGTLDNLEPEGTIRLGAGQVNLFTTQFVAARGYPQTATFTRANGRDPILDIRLISSVPEVTRSRAPTNNPAEVREEAITATGVGALQTVRIQARVTGPASQLFDNLELTSSPGRTRNEIIGLIGGGFVNTLGRGDSTLGIANLAGSALLTNIQGFIGNALGVSEFRLFPTIQRNDRSRESTLGLAAELGVDITPKLSGSVLKVLTGDQPAQFGARYRFNDYFLFRGSTDFSGDSRAVFEFEKRF